MLKYPVLLQMMVQHYIITIKINFSNNKGFTIFVNPLFNWYARLDSNQRLSAPEADALSPELRAHKNNSECGMGNAEKSFWAFQRFP